jgi:hypothetical protein
MGYEKVDVIYARRLDHPERTASQQKIYEALALCNS